MLSTIFSACLLVALITAIHASGIAMRLPRLKKLDALPPTRVLPNVGMLLRMLYWLVLLHLSEISVWAVFYLWRRCMLNAEAAFYFSGATYTTLGYGELVLAGPWRLLGPIEALVGILMLGLSTGYFFVVVNRSSESRQARATVVPSAGGIYKEP
jgi:Ion channel